MKIQVFATDISDNSHSKGTERYLPGNELEAVSPARVQQFFCQTGRQLPYQQKPFAICAYLPSHNLLKDPPFSKIDLVSCRNVLIYLEPILQKRRLLPFIIL